MIIIELELDLINFFFWWQVLDLVVIFFFYKKEVEDLHESFPGFAFLILIFFFNLEGLLYILEFRVSLF